MRFLFLTNFYPPADLGGWEQWCQEIAVEFRHRGHEVTVLTSRFRRDEVEDVEPSIFRDLYMESDLEAYKPMNFFLRLRQRDKDNEERLRAIIESEKPDIVFIWGMWQLNPQLAALTEELCPGRVVYYFCGFWPIPEEESNPHQLYWQRHAFPFGKIALKRLARDRGTRPSCKYVACVSQFVLDTYNKHGFEFIEGKVIYGGIDTEAFTRPSIETHGGTEAPEKPIRLLFAGTLSSQKGADTVVEAMALLAKRHDPSQVHLSIVGNGHPNFVQSLYTLAESEGLKKYVTFRGRIPKEEMANLFHQHDVLLFASTWEEPLARMMMEGLAASTVVISTPTGGSKEAIKHGENGLIFTTGNSHDLAEKIDLVLTDPFLAKRLSENGYQSAVERFDFQRMANELEDFCIHRK